MKSQKLIEILKEIKNVSSFTREWFGSRFNLNSLYYLIDQGYIDRIGHGHYVISAKGFQFLQTLTETSQKQMPKISFGIEFEGNVRSYKHVIENAYIPHRYYCVESWDYQTDPTATFELRSPVWTDINEAFLSIQNEFREWISQNNGCVPFFRPTRYFKSIGGHIHIGIGKGKMLDKQTAQMLIDKIIPFLPYLYYINANGTITKHLSYRLIERPYSPLKYDKDIASCGRAEFHLSEHGTIEFRRFDANIPAVQLAIVYLMKNIFESQNIESQDCDMGLIQKIIDECCKYPPSYRVLLEVRKNFEKLKDLDISNLPLPIKQVLVLSFCFLKNPSTFVGTFSYEFCKRAAEDCAFLDENDFTGEKKKVVQTVNKIASEAKTFGDLLNIIILDKETQYLFALQKIQGVFSTLTKQQSKIVEKWLKKPREKPPFITKKMWSNMNIEQNSIRWLRLRELNFTQAKQLENLTNKSWKAMIEDVCRYIVKIKNNDVVGYILINFPEKRLVEYNGNVEISEVKTICKHFEIPFESGGEN